MYFLRPLCFLCLLWLRRGLPDLGDREYEPVPTCFRVELNWKFELVFPACEAGRYGAEFGEFDGLRNVHVVTGAQRVETIFDARVGG